MATNGHKIIIFNFLRGTRPAVGVKCILTVVVVVIIIIIIIINEDY